MRKHKDLVKGIESKSIAEKSTEAFSLKDLREGMLIKTSESWYVALTDRSGRLFFADQDGWLSLDDYDANLRTIDRSYPEFDIEAVYDSVVHGRKMDELYDPSNRALIWIRDE